MATAEPQRQRLDSALEAEGAEFLVLGLLLVEGIQAMKAYGNQPDWDLIATNPATNRSCSIQVKSRWATDYDRSFPLKRFGTDFVVHVALNRGYRYQCSRLGPDGDAGRRPPDVYVFPLGVAQAAWKESGSWGKVHLREIPHLETYRDNWDLVRDFLSR